MKEPTSTITSNKKDQTRVDPTGSLSPIIRDIKELATGHESSTSLKSVTEGSNSYEAAFARPSRATHGEHIIKSSTGNDENRMRESAIRQLPYTAEIDYSSIGGGRAEYPLSYYAEHPPARKYSVESYYNTIRYGVSSSGTPVVSTASTAALQTPVLTTTAATKIAEKILTAQSPVELKEGEIINVHGQTGQWVNKEEVLNWKGPIPISDYAINEDLNPEIIKKKPDKQVVYIQELAVRYLRPPTPPPPGDIIIKEERSSLVPPAPPLVIRQQPPRPETPPPLVIREAPPKPPPQLGTKVVTISGKRMPPPPRKVIIERLPPLPPKPQTIIVERWLPYKERKRRVIFQRNSESDIIVQKPKNVIIQWETPAITVHKDFKDLGVVRANPTDYIEKYGNSLKTSHELPDFVKNIQPPGGIQLAADLPQKVCDLEGDVQALSLVDLELEGLGEYKYAIHQQTILKSEGSFGGLSGYGMQSQYIPSSGTYQAEPTQQGIISNAQLNEIFRMINRDANGYVNVEEARRILFILNERLGRSYSNQDAQAVIRLLDRNSIGKIDYEEFKQALLACI